MDPRVLPPRAHEKAQAFLELGPEVVAPRDSASVLLVRQGAGGPELCTLLRHHAMATSGGVLVFPGGLVDAQDLDGAAPWVTGHPEEWASTLELDQVLARAVVTAAVRELFEETGVLLAGASGAHVAAEPPDGWLESRRRLEAHEESFSDFLTKRGWGVRADLLHLWSTWLTPEFETRRYRARFFVVELPDGQSPRLGSTESTETRWHSPSDLVAGARAGILEVLAPQFCLSLQLTPYADVDEIAAACAGVPRPLVSPGVELVDGVPRLLLPADLLELAGVLSP